ncbi:MAG: helix-turn-helix domain-containing protein [Selenomonadaceae bacterium]|nr:helix-turn-helix domain-containing protein [Selenomonadaceae bacterium]
MKKFFSVKEVAEILGVSKSLIYAKICNGQIPSRRIGRRILIPATYVEEILAA